MKVTNLPGHDSWILLLLLGLVCLFLAPLVAPWTTRLAGLVLVVLGAEQSVEGFQERKYQKKEQVQPALGMLLIITGLVVLWQGEGALVLVCAIWGVFGLLQAAHALNHVLAAAVQHRFSWWKCTVAVLEVILALELIFTSGEAIVLHVRLLGLELLTAAFAYRSRELVELE